LVRLKTQLEAANAELQKLSATDALTKLCNRRKLDEVLDQEWRRCRREQAPLDGAMTVAESLRRAVEALRLAHAGSEAAEHVTLSVGVGSVDALDGGSIAELVAATDAALYEAKRSGRNRVASAPPRP
jgi:PleD family two-component response regulator